MGKKANPAVIGAFVVGAIALLVVGLVLFGSGQLFKRTQQYVIFFSGAVDGLNVGAPVKFKGVEVGSVKSIRLRFGQGGIDAKQVAEGIRIPVIVEIDYDKVSGQGGTSAGASVQAVKHLIDLGMRAQLDAQSLVTGLLFVQLDFDPDLPAVYVLPPDGDHLPEIPAIPTTMQAMQSAAEGILRKIEELHLENLVKSLGDAFDGVNKVINAPALHAAIEALPGTVANVNETVASIHRLVTNLDREQGPLMGEVKATVASAGTTLANASATLATVQGVVDPSAPLLSELATALQEISGAARSLRLLADDLKRNPSTIVRGKDVSNR